MSYDNHLRCKKCEEAQHYGQAACPQHMRVGAPIVKPKAFKFEAQLENIKVEQFPSLSGGLVQVRIGIVGVCKEGDANKIVEHWRKKKCCTVDELFTDLGYMVTLDFKGAGVSE
jgi:hypothetical protein